MKYRTLFRQCSFVLLILSVSLTSVWAANLFINGDLEDDIPLEDYYSPSNPRGSISLHTEENGNKCLKVAATAYNSSDEVNFNLAVGGAQTGPSKEDNYKYGNSIVLDPGRSYEFSFEVYGDFQPFNVRQFAWPDNPALEDTPNQGRLTSDVADWSGPFNMPDKPGWQRYSGELVFPAAGANAPYHYFSLRIGFYGSKTKYPELPIFCLMDNFFITEKREPIEVAPTDFNATRNNGSADVSLSWSEIQDAEEYLIYRSDQLVATVEGTSWTDETAAYEQAYSYTVSAKNYKGEGPRSEEVTAERMGYVEGIVQGDDDSLISGAVISSDTGLSDVHTDETGWFRLGPLVLGNYNLEVAAPRFTKSEYGFGLTTSDPEHNLGTIILPSDNDPPYPPILIKADEEQQKGVVVLTWSAPSTNPDDVAEYNIYRSLAEPMDRNTPPIATVTKDTLVYYDIIEPEGFEHTFYYQIESVDAAGNPSAEGSNVLSTKVVTPPVPEASLPAEGAVITEFPLDFTWIAVEDPNLNGYSIQLSSSPDFPGDSRTQLLSGDSALQCTIIEPLTQGTWYWRVNALFDCNALVVKSAWSEIKTFVTLTDDTDRVAPYVNIAPQILRHDEVKISYYLTMNAKVQVRIFNLKGQLVKTIDTGQKDSGLHEFMWDGKNNQKAELRNGLYLVQVKIEVQGKGETIITKKVLINR